MARPARFTHSGLLSSAAELAARGGPRAVTMQGLAVATGASSGSVYHRFSGRVGLLAEVWLAAVERFQGVWWPGACSASDAGAAAVLPVRWARRNRDWARVLLVHRAEDFLADDIAPGLRERARLQQQQAAGRFEALAGRFLGEISARAIERTRFALATVPIAAARAPLSADAPIPEHLDQLVRESACALLQGPR